MTLSWHAPPAVAGAPVTDYIVQYALSGSGTFTTIDEGSTATTAAVTGLTNNVSYDFQVSAVNSGGQGPPSAIATASPSAQLLPDPGFEAGNGGWIAFKTGTLSRITTPVHGGATSLQVTSPSATAGFTGLTQNTVVNNSVAGRTYVASCWVRPTTSSLNVHIRFLEYTQNFGSVINLQDNVTAALPVGVWTFVQVSSVAAKSGERMIPQIFSTTQTSANGAMLYDDCSMTASSGTGPPTAPSAPTAVTATAGNGSASVTFTAPSANGSPITGYTVTSTPGNITATGTAAPIGVTGLTNGTSYTFTVTAANAVGPGPASAASNAVTPATTPSAPTAVTATAGDAAASVAFTPPASNGGAPITGYTVTASPGGATATGSASPIVVNGLTNGTRYTFVVTATNSAGPGAASAASNAVTPVHIVGVPGAPTGVSATPGNASARVSFSPPASNGGSTITGYVVTSTPGGVAASGSTSPITVPTLTNGTSYTFTVAAVNASGPGPDSAASNAVTPSAQLLPDAGFESGNGGWIAFNVGTLSRVAAPVHGGAFALKVTAVSTATSLVGLTQNTAVTTSVAGRTYTASCYVQPTTANLNVQIRILEYTQNFSSSTRFQGPVIASLPVNTWTLLQVSAVAARSGERMIPQIYSGNETTNTGSLVYDDCSLTAG